MLFILILAMQIGDKVEPSHRVQALGINFANLIDDFITDIQDYPAKLSYAETREIYIRPAWTPYNLPTLRAAVIAPGIYRRLGLGLMAGYSLTQFYDSTTVHDTGQVNIDVNYWTQHNPDERLFVSFPLIKDGGFFGFRLSLNHPDVVSRYQWYTSYIDTILSGATDTLIYESAGNNRNNNISKDKNWVINGNQYFTLGASGLDIILKIGHKQNNVNRYDSSLSHQISTYIDNLDSIRNVIIHTMAQEDHSNEYINNRSWFGNVGFAWTYYTDWGMLKLIGQCGLEDRDDQNDLFFRNKYIDIYRNEYTDPDTSYVIVDTTANSDSAWTDSLRENEKLDREEMGFGLTSHVNDNIDFFLGLKAIRSHMISKIEADSRTDEMTTYEGILPLGGEFFVTSGFCIRAGFAVNYYTSSMTSKEAVGSDIHHSNNNLTISKSFGLGFLVKSKLQIDLYNQRYYLIDLNEWGLEAMYRF